MILVIGDSFTSGEELAHPFNDAWPAHLVSGNREIIMNMAQPGFSNDAIIRTAVTELANPTSTIDKAIIAWTTPHRIEVNEQHLTPTSHRKYGSICDVVFLDWKEDWAVHKLRSQVLMMEGFLRSRKIKYLFVRTFDVPELDVGTWLPGQMVDWMGDCPKGPGGHPLELGHQRIAEYINEHIRNIGWFS